MSVKPEVEDIVKPLRKGSARLHGWLGKGLNLSIENRLKKVSYPHPVDPIVLAQDSRLDEVDVPIAPGEGKVVEAPEGIRLAYRLPDGTMLCDYASAGNLFRPENTLCVWMQKKR